MNATIEKIEKVGPNVVATVLFGGTDVATFKSDTGEFIPVAPTETTTNGKIALWYGADNLFPNNVLKDIKSTPQLSSTIYWKANALISGGLKYGYEEEDKEGNMILKPIKNPEIETFFFNTNIKLVLRELTHEFYHYWNTFPQLIRPKGVDKFTGIKVHDSVFCRWGMQNDKGLIDTCYINPDWTLYSADSKKVKTVAAIYKNLDRLESTRERRRPSSFIYPVAGTSSGNIYYELAPWNAIRESGWLSFLKQIPTFKEAMIKNVMGARYHIIMPDWWMPYKYDDWETKKESEKLSLYKAEFNTFKDFVCGAENAGKAIMTTALTNPLTKEKYKGWEFELLPQPKLDEAYNNDLEIASSMLYNSLGVHGSVVATLPGKSGLGSKGSEIRNLFNMYISNSKPEQDIILEPLEFIAMYNGWGTPSAPIKFWFHNYWLTTLDQVTPSKRKFNAPPTE